MTTVGIVGSWHWTDYEAFVVALPPLVGVRRIVSGGAYGVDQMAKPFRQENPHFEWQQFRPDTVTYRTFTEATHARNQQIVDASDWLIAMPGPNSKGTYDTIRRARKKGIRVVIIEAPV